MPSSLDQNSPVAPGSTSDTNLSDVAEWSVSWKALRQNILQRRLLVFALTLLGLAIGASLAFLPRHYQSTSRLQIRPGSANQYKLDPSELLQMGDSSTKLESETAVLQSDTLLLDMARSLNLQNDPEFIGKSHVGSSLDDPEARDRLLKNLHTAVTVTHLPRSEVIYVSAKSRSPRLSADMVNTLVKDYIDHLFQSRFASSKRVADWLSGQLEGLRQKVQKDQEQLVQLQDQLGVVGLDQNHDIGVTELEDLTKAADEASVARIIAEARYRILSSGDINLLEGGGDILGRDVPSNSQLSLLSNLRNQKAQAESRYAALSAQFGDKYPDVVQAKAELQTLDKEVTQEQQRVLNQSSEAFKAAQQNEQTTKSMLDRQKDTAYGKHDAMVRYEILLHDFQSSRALYEGLLSRLEQAGIVSGLESSEVDVFDVARIPSSPTEMGRGATMAIGLSLGLAVGLIGAVLLGQLDNRLHSLSEIESDIHLPLLSITPSMSNGEQRRHADLWTGASTNITRVFAEDPHGAFVESMWSLRTSIMLSSPGRPPRCIVLTSCNPQEGKSTLASGLGCAYALRNARVLLLEGDMRRPGLSAHFGIPPTSVGFSSILTGSATLQQAVQPVKDFPGLFVLPAGRVPPSPAAILGSDAMAELMRNISAEFDVVIIDSPPALGLADSVLLAQFAETIVLVLSYTSFNKAQVRRARNLLARAGKSITGIALNFSTVETLDYYGSGYSYYTLDQKETKA
jgi:succinoglycan biosynthesis transport protein ExoP